MEHKKEEELISNYLANQATHEENAMIETWYNAYTSNLPDLPQTMDFEAEKLQLWNSIHINHKKSLAISYQRMASIAAAILLVCGAGVLLYFYNVKQKAAQKIEFASRILPGVKGSMLTLANGKQVILSSTNIGAFAEESDATIQKTAEGQVVYSQKDQINGKKTSTYNTLTTTLGQQFQLVLADGSKIWLNAGSSIRFPTSFSGLNAREVYLSGEAYFEVAKQNIPFYVKSKNQLVDVLGTHFNVSAYDDETKVTTTLLEGSVKVTSRNRSSAVSIVIKPDHQTIYDGNLLKSRETVSENSVAWKNGMFSFDNEPMSEVMRKISRWYNVKVRFEDPELEKLSAFGSISKYSNVLKVLDLMEKTGKIHFDIKENLIIVRK